MIIEPYNWGEVHEHIANFLDRPSENFYKYEKIYFRFRHLEENRNNYLHQNFLHFLFRGVSSPGFPERETGPIVIVLATSGAIRLVEFKKPVLMNAQFFNVKEIDGDSKIIEVHGIFITNRIIFEPELLYSQVTSFLLSGKSIQEEWEKVYQPEIFSHKLL
jgi:hypothetical protein